VYVDTVGALALALAARDSSDNYSRCTPGPRSSLGVGVGTEITQYQLKIPTPKLNRWLWPAATAVI
jgi:hypothetical protein